MESKVSTRVKSASAIALAVMAATEVAIPVSDVVAMVACGYIDKERCRAESTRMPGSPSGAPNSGVWPFASVISSSSATAGTLMSMGLDDWKTKG